MTTPKTVGATAPGYHPVEPNNVQVLMARILKGTASNEERFIPDHDLLVGLLDALRASGCIVAFTTGVWDLFHIGHAEYIRRGKQEVAKLYPDADHIVMVVGVDTDALTKERKGPTRPIVPEGERYQVLGHLRHVDVITPQYEASTLYRIIPHDVRIISTSTTDLPADTDDIRAQCAHLVDLPPQAETSTTQRIRVLAMDGGKVALDRVAAKLKKAIEEAQNELLGT